MRGSCQINGGAAGIVRPALRGLVERDAAIKERPPLTLAGRRTREVADTAKKTAADAIGIFKLASSISRKVSICVSREFCERSFLLDASRFCEYLV